MATEWFYFKADERIGPVDPNQLKTLASTGKLLPTDLIWKEGMEQPVPASKLKGLFGASPPKAQAIPVARAVPIETSSDNVADDSQVESIETSSSQSWLYKHRIWLIGGLSSGVFLAFALCCGVPIIFGLLGKKDGQPSGSGKKYTDYLSAEELSAMKHPIKAENISEAHKQSQKKGVEFIRWTHSDDSGSFMVDGNASKTIKDVKFHGSGDSIWQLTEYHPNGKKKLFVYFDKKSGEMTSEEQYDTDGYEIHKVVIGKRHEEYFIEGGVRKGVWHYANGKKATEFYNDDPRGGSSRNLYWDENGNKIDQDTFCKAEYGEDWRANRSKEGDRIQKEFLKEAPEIYKKVREK